MTTSAAAAAVAAALPTVGFYGHMHIHTQDHTHDHYISQVRVEA